MYTGNVYNLCSILYMNCQQTVHQYHSLLVAQLLVLKCKEWCTDLDFYTNHYCFPTTHHLEQIPDCQL